MGVDQSIASHYAHGALERAILDALRSAGKDPERLTHADLAALDEFHIGGRQATMEVAARLGLPRGARALDVGCGIGGPARYFAAERGLRVDGVDLTEEYVGVATSLSRRVGLGGLASFHHAGAAALPFADATFDGAYMLHVGMNVPDKRSVFAEVRRALKPGGVFAVYDIMRENDGPFLYPVPWSSAPETNLIDTAANYRRFLADAGFDVDAERSRRDFARDFFRQMRERMAKAQADGAPPPPGLPVIMGPTAPQKIANMVALLERGTIAPTEMIARAR